MSSSPDFPWNIQSVQVCKHSNNANYKIRAKQTPVPMCRFNLQQELNLKKRTSSQTSILCVIFIILLILLSIYCFIKLMNILSKLNVDVVVDLEF